MIGLRYWDRATTTRAAAMPMPMHISGFKTDTAIPVETLVNTAEPGIHNHCTFLQMGTMKVEPHQRQSTHRDPDGNAD